MKRLSYLLALLFCCQISALAQLTPNFLPVQFRIFIANSDVNPPFLYQYPNGEFFIYFSDPNINAIFANYTITQFEQSCPACRRPYMQRYWDIETDNPTLIDDLLNYDSMTFSDAQIILPVTATYTPNDYGMATGQQNDLELINARSAWDITTGNPSVVVGITDVWFDFTNPDLPLSKFAERRSTVADAGPLNHGTAVAGCVAGETDNGVGLSSIGFNTRLDISTHRTDKEMQQMSEDGRRILNASWFYSNQFDIFKQQMYDDIYENGTIAFWGAGNGKDHYNYGTIYPPAYNHNFAVTAIGYDQSPTATENIADVHEKVPGDATTASSHYPEVDLCAPGYQINVALSGSTSSSGTYFGQRDGTSFASPMTAGTAALMLAVNPCLSPYQIEHILKETSETSIYSKPENAAYIGKLGTGRLNAQAAVNRAINYDCNDPETQTMDIKGVELNTICAPGFASNGVKPQLIPVIVNGTAPYTYEWHALEGNESTLDNMNIANPTILSSTGNHVAHYYLIVKDASDIQKVASREILIHLLTSGYDLAMRDSYLDMLDEPNSQITVDRRAFDTWDAPDIWNRHLDDDGLDHQNPEYYPTDSNYLYVRVRNVGCEAAPGNAKVRLYWTLASTGENWPDNWTTSNYLPNPVLPAGRQITTTPLDVPVLQPGDATILSKGWKPQNPTDYDPSLNELDACVLARIEETSTFPFGMTINEVGGTITLNVRNNNNIITRNMVIANMMQYFSPISTHLTLVANPETTAQYYTLQLVDDRVINPHFAGNLSAVISPITIYLGDILYARWQSGGFQGTYGFKDDGQKAVVFDGSSPMIELKHILLNAGESFPIKTIFYLRDLGEMPNAQFALNLRQINESNNSIYGNIRYQITSAPYAPAQPMMQKIGHDETGLYRVYPNPAAEKVTIEYQGKNQQVNIVLYDITGRLVLKEEGKIIGYDPHDINLKKFIPGIYVIAITDQKGKTNYFKIVKQ